MARKQYADMSLEELKAKKLTLLQQNYMIAGAGLVGGLAMAYKQGGGLVRYAVYGLGNAIILGFLPRLFYFVPRVNEIDALIKDKETKTNS
jgi:hypothetical protein